MAGGRPTVVTPSVVIKLEQAFSIGASITEACIYADISRNTIYEYMKTHPEFQDRIDELQERPILKARQTVVQSLNDPVHAFRYLEKKRKSEFGNSLDLTTDGKAFEVSSEQKALADAALAHILNENKGNTRQEG